MSSVFTFQGNLPESMSKRILKPSGRGRRPNSTLNSAYNMASMGAYANLANAQLMAAYGKLPLAFSGMQSMAAFNPALYASMAGYGLLPGMTAAPEGEKKEAEPEGDEELEAGEIRREAAAAPHPSFGLMYNPMMMQMLAAQGINLGSMAGLPQMQAMVNGTQLLQHADASDDESEPKAGLSSTQSPVKKAKLSAASDSTSQDQPVDFSKVAEPSPGEATTTDSSSSVHKPVANSPLTVASSSTSLHTQESPSPPLASPVDTDS